MVHNVPKLPYECTICFIEQNQALHRNCVCVQWSWPLQPQSFSGQHPSPISGVCSVQLTSAEPILKVKYILKLRCYFTFEVGRVWPSTQVFQPQNWTPLKILALAMLHISNSSFHFSWSWKCHCGGRRKRNNSLAGGETPSNCMLDRARQRAVRALFMALLFAATFHSSP